MNAPYAVLRPARSAWPRLSLRALLARIAEADARYRAREAARRLDDHILRDIGVTRADLEHALRGPTAGASLRLVNEGR